MADISKIYQGGYDSLDPAKAEYATGYQAKAREIGTSINPQTANQLGEVNRILNQGFIPIEMSALSPDIFDAIPKQHFEEIKRVSKLTGSQMSMHAPIQNMETSGLTQQGWSESNRQLIENQLKDVVRKSFDLIDKGGPAVPITIHASNMAGSEFKMYVDPETGERKSTEDVLLAVDQDTYQIVPIKEEIKYQVGMTADQLKEGRILSPKAGLELANSSKWDNSIDSAIIKKDGADRILEGIPVQGMLKEIYQLKSQKGAEASLNPEQRDVWNRIKTAETYLDDVSLEATSLFNKAYKYGTDDQKKKLVELSEKYRKKVYGPGEDAMKKMSEQEYASTVLNQTSPKYKSEALNYLLGELKSEELVPDLYRSVEDFAIEKSSETFANVALESYQMAKKTGKNASIISIENMYPGMAFHESKNMNALVDASRERFVENAVQSGVMSKSEAAKQAEKLIGVTLDVGHLNISRKKGFSEEDIKKEAAAMAKNVKHVHLTDNFGYTDSHLAPGMGNVPIKDIMENLEKQGFEGRKIVEAGGLINHFKESPTLYSLGALNAPMYSSGQGGAWSTSYGLQQGYFGGFGGMLPQTNYQMFGAGFSQLPAELGGSAAGGQGSRMSGSPME